MIKKGCYFSKNGNRYKKVSTNTAYLPEYDKTFYFAQNEYVTVTNINKVKI